MSRAITRYGFTIFFLSAESCINSSLMGIFQVFHKLGATSKVTDSLQAWAEKGSSVTVRFSAEQRCTFEKESTRTMESPEVTVVTTTSKRGGILPARSTEKTASVKVKVKEYHWRLEHKYCMFAFRGNKPDDDTIDIISNTTGTIELVTRAEGEAPFGKPSLMLFPHIDFSATYLMQMAGCKSFAINRSDAKCHTPSRNPDINMSLESLTSLSVWAARVHEHFKQTVFPLLNLPSDATAKEDATRIHLESIMHDGVFVPILPLMEMTEEGKQGGSRGGAGAGGRVQLSMDDVSLIMCVLPYGVVRMCLCVVRVCVSCVSVCVSCVCECGC